MKKAKTSRWFKDGNFWLDPKSGDAGDVIFNTMSRIIDMEDKSDWAHAAFDECKQLLIEGKRWPDRMNQEDTADTILQWKVSKILKSLRLVKDDYTRPQKFMTRDPYVAVFTCAFFLERPEDMLVLNIPWYCYSKETWKWWRLLIRDNQKIYVKRLDYYRSLCIVIKNGDDENIVSNKLEAGL